MSEVEIFRPRDKKKDFMGKKTFPLTFYSNEGFLESEKLFSFAVFLPQWFIYSWMAMG